MIYFNLFMLLLVNLDIGAVNKMRQQRNCEGGDRKMAIFADVQDYLYWHKAELPQVGIFFALNFLPWEFLLIKKLEI